MSLSADISHICRYNEDGQACRYGEIVADQIRYDYRHEYRHILSADFYIGRSLDTDLLYVLIPDQAAICRTIWVRLQLPEEHPALGILY